MASSSITQPNARTFPLVDIVSEVKGQRSARFALAYDLRKDSL